MTADPNLGAPTVTGRVAAVLRKAAA